MDWIFEATARNFAYEKLQKKVQSVGSSDTLLWSCRSQPNWIPLGSPTLEPTLASSNVGQAFCFFHSLCRYKGLILKQHTLVRENNIPVETGAEISKYKGKRKEEETLADLQNIMRRKVITLCTAECLQRSARQRERENMATWLIPKIGLTVPQQHLQQCRAGQRLDEDWSFAITSSESSSTTRKHPWRR